MKEVKVIIDGKEYVTKLDEKQIEAITKPPKPLTGYERVKIGEPYYTASIIGARKIKESGQECDDALYRDGNYVNNEKLGIARYHAETIHRQLEQYQALSDKPVDWTDTTRPKFFIGCQYMDKIANIKVMVATDIQHANEVYFNDADIAKTALMLFRDELIWLHTKYMPRLDAIPIPIKK